LYSQLEPSEHTVEVALTEPGSSDLELTIDGRLLRLPAVWLRDNCLCPDCVVPGTTQKIRDITDMPNGVAITRTGHAGDTVTMTFAPDQHRATFSRSWLAANAPDRDGDDDERAEDAKELWLATDLDPAAGRFPVASWPMTGIGAIAELFAGPGARDYLGEAVTIGEHMRQAGALAEAAGAPAPLVAAALLHDVGHLRNETDARHGAGGAAWLSRWFGPAVTEPVRLHVAAKRYLCAAEPGYAGLLSPESVRTLALQGGPMTPDQVTAFEALPYARDAVAVRRWDDHAKDPAVTPPEFARFAPLLTSLPGCGTGR
jgi:phosphonate degradation associated HDIG domain protein